MGVEILQSVELAARKWPKATADIPCGWRELQRIVGGFVGGDMCVIGGDTSAGKSHVTLALMAAMADAGVAGCYLSIEDPPVRVGRRLAAGYARAALSVAFPGPSSTSVAETIRVAGAQGCRVFGADYAQLLQYDGGPGAWSEAAALKAAVAQLRMANQAVGGVLLLVSQVNPPHDYSNPPDFPTLDQLTGTKHLKRSADVVLMVASPGGRLQYLVAKLKDRPCLQRVTLTRDAAGCVHEAGLVSAKRARPAEDEDGQPEW